jgi:hypothetical protein
MRFRKKWFIFTTELPYRYTDFPAEQVTVSTFIPRHFTPTEAGVAQTGGRPAVVNACQWINKH